MAGAIAVLDAAASDVWLSPVVGAVAISRPTGGQSQSRVSRAEAAGLARASVCGNPSASSADLGESGGSQ